MMADEDLRWTDGRKTAAEIPVHCSTNDACCSVRLLSVGAVPEATREFSAKGRRKPGWA